MYQSTTVVGNLGRDPEKRFTDSGTPVTSFSLAVNETWTKDGEKHEKVTWFKVTAWRRLAETCAQYLSQGRSVLVEGTLAEPKPYKGRDGEWRASLELTAHTVKFLGGKEPQAEELDELPF